MTRARTERRSNARLLSALGVAGLALMASCTAGESGSDNGIHVLTEDEGWQLAVTDGAEPEGPRLQLRAEQERSVRNQGVSDYTRPVILDEATSFTATRDDGDITLVAGPVNDDAQEVQVESADERVDATLEAAHGLTWFWAELPGSHQISAITAHDAERDVVDEYTLRPMPPPDESPVDEPADPEGGLD